MGCNNATEVKILAWNVSLEDCQACKPPELHDRSAVVIEVRNAMLRIVVENEVPLSWLDSMRMALNEGRWLPYRCEVAIVLVWTLASNVLQHESMDARPGGRMNGWQWIVEAKAQTSIRGWHFHCHGLTASKTNDITKIPCHVAAVSGT